MRRVCGYCTGRIRPHDDVYPWKCTVCNRLLRETETKVERTRAEV